MTRLAKILFRPKKQRARQLTPIVPPGNVSGHALIAVIAIMTFLSCLTLGAVTLVRDTAATWQNEISREATIQIRPGDGLDMAAQLAEAQRIAAGFPGVRKAEIVDRDATARLLEPWLGRGLDIDELPVPRLVIVTIEEDQPPDYQAMRRALRDKVRNVSLDDHRNWIDRLVAMARTTVAIGLGALILILSATVLTVIFATRGAMAGSAHIIEVLHFVGAEAKFIASQFRQHFLIVSLKGAAAGGLTAMLVFVAFSWWSSQNLATPEADQATALFGDFTIGIDGYSGVAVIVVVIAALTAITTHLTVIAYLGEVDARHPDSP